MTAQYSLVDPTTGKQWSLSTAELTRNLRINCILLRGDEHLGIITHRDLVIFARWCDGKILAQVKKPPDHRVTKALALVDRWLEDEVNLSNEELEAAAKAAWAAADAARAARAAWAAWAAAEAARAAARAAGAAWAAAEAARAAHVASYISYKAQAQWLVEHLQSGK